MNPAAKTHINRATLNQLDELQEAGEPSFAVELILVLFKSAPPLLDKMRQGLKDSDHHSVIRAAHSLKSSAANLGAELLHGFCLQIEKSADLSKAKGPVDQALAEYESVKVELSAIIKEKNGKVA